VTPATPLGQKWGGPPFLAKATPTADLEVVEPPPWPRGKKKSYGFMGGLELQALGGGSTIPKNPKPIPFFFFFFFFFFSSSSSSWLFGGGRTTPLAMGVVRPLPDQPWGWLKPPPISLFFLKKLLFIILIVKTTPF
jgi:hypothetical protein